MVEDILSAIAKQSDSPAKKIPPIFDPDRDELLVSPFPMGCGAIDYYPKGDHKPL